MPRLSYFNVNSIKTYGYSPYFPEFASVSFKKTFSRSTTVSTSSARQELENARIESCNSNLFDCEQLDSFTSLVYSNIYPQQHAISYIACQENFYGTPKLSSVVVTEDLIVKPFVLSTPLPSLSFCHIIAGTKLSNTSELLNILALCKSLSQMDSSINSKVFISSAINCLEMFNIHLQLPHLGPSFTVQ